MQILSRTQLTVRELPCLPCESSEASRQWCYCNCHLLLIIPDSLTPHLTSISSLPPIPTPSPTPTPRPILSSYFFIFPTLRITGPPTPMEYCCLVRSLFYFDPHSRVGLRSLAVPVDRLTEFRASGCAGRRALDCAI